MIVLVQNYLMTCIILVISVYLGNAGSDYIFFQSVASFASGSMNGDIECDNITLLEDGALEGDQIFFLLLKSLDPDVIIGGNTTTIIIRDNDSK